MNRKEWIQKYWNYYLVLEKKFLVTVPYVEIAQANYCAYSNEYAAFIETTGAELDTFFKIFCGFATEDNKNIADYAKVILRDYPEIRDEVVLVQERDFTLIPFKGWDENCAKQSLKWWSDFDSLKHNRAESMTNANQENALNILAALFLLEMRYYKEKIVHDKDGNLTGPDMPDPESQVFAMKGWNFEFIPTREAYLSSCKLVSEEPAESSNDSEQPLPDAQK